MKCIFFDLDGTLFDTRKLVEQSRRNSVAAMIEAGLPGTEEEVYDSLLKIVEKTGSNYDRHFNELLKERQVQMAGRIVRTPDDVGHIFILDRGFDRFKRVNGHLLPSWFSNAIQPSPNWLRRHLP